jgi:hypothetical protein
MRRDSEVDALVIVPSPIGMLALTPAQIAEAVERAKVILPREHPASAATPGVEPLVDAARLGELTGVPGSWWAEQARQEQLPHFKFGRYTRFRLSEVLACERFLERAR